MHMGFVATHALALAAFCGSSCTHATHDHTSCTHHEFPQSHCGDNWEGTLFS